MAENLKKISRDLARKGVLVVEAAYPLSKLSDEIDQNGYSILYAAEVTIDDNEFFRSVAVVWPKANGQVPKDINFKATVLGKDSLSGIQASALTEKLKRLNAS